MSRTVIVLTVVECLLIGWAVGIYELFHHIVTKIP